MNFIGSQASSDIDGVVVVHLDKGQMQIPVSLALVGHCGEHLCHRMIHAFGPTVSGRVVGTSKNTMGAQETSDRGRKFAGKMRAVIGQQTFGDTPLRDVCVHENVGSSFCTIVSLRNSMHNSVSTEPIRKQQNVLVTTISEGQRAKVVPRKLSLQGHSGGGGK